jgi:hypothetical protein
MAAAGATAEAAASTAAAGATAEAEDTVEAGGTGSTAFMKQERTNMFHLSIRKLSIVPCALLALCTLAQAQSAGQPLFKSAAEASQALYQAVQSNDSQAIAKILGGPSELASAQDESQDKLDRDSFVQQYQEMHRLRKEDDGLITMYIGARNWPFPIPLAQKDGSWYFDSDAGLKEVLYRRVGENELGAMATCQEFVAAEKRYRTTSNAADPLESSPVSLVAAAAGGASTPVQDPVLLSGYYFHVLEKRPFSRTRPRPFTFIAYPAEYRASGVMTFVVTEKGVVYEKDLGDKTADIAGKMAKFHKDATWRVAGQ